VGGGGELWILRPLICRVDYVKQEAVAIGVKQGTCLFATKDKEYELGNI
jgi:hypothetical protein